MHKYKLLGKKGEGTFSEVVKAQMIKNGKFVAIKRMKNSFESIEQVNNLREIQALRRLSPHANIVKLQEVLYDKQSGRLALVFELMSMNIYELIRQRKTNLPEPLVKNYMYQLCKSMDHMHRNGIFHRDIKPENILIVEEKLKLADFGSCRGIYSKQPYTEYISTRWYRAPECLLTDGYYNYKMDMWGVGCVFFEIMTRFPLFPGKDEVDQVQKIHNIIGTPPPEYLAKLKNLSKGGHINFNFAPTKGTGLVRLLPHASKEAIHLLERLLAYNPDDRLSARQALKHPYFKELREREKLARKEAIPEGIGDPNGGTELRKDHDVDDKDTGEDNVLGGAAANVVTLYDADEVKASSVILDAKSVEGNQQQPSNVASPAPAPLPPPQHHAAPAPAPTAIPIQPHGSPILPPGPGLLPPIAAPPKLVPLAPLAPVVVSPDKRLEQRNGGISPHREQRREAPLSVTNLLPKLGPDGTLPPVVDTRRGAKRWPPGGSGPLGEGAYRSTSYLHLGEFPGLTGYGSTSQMKKPKKYLSPNSPEPVSGDGSKFPSPYALTGGASASQLGRGPLERPHGLGGLILQPLSGVSARGPPGVGLGPIGGASTGRRSQRYNPSYVSPYSQKYISQHRSAYA